jgi:hypothetical protein
MDKNAMERAKKQARDNYLSALALLREMYPEFDTPNPSFAASTSYTPPTYTDPNARQQPAGGTGGADDAPPGMSDDAAEPGTSSGGAVSEPVAGVVEEPTYGIVEPDDPNTNLGGGGAPRLPVGGSGSYLR